MNQDLTQSELAYKRRLRNDQIDAQRARNNRAQPRRQRHRLYDEYEHDEELDDRRARRVLNTNPRSLPTRFIDDYAEEPGRSASNSKRGQRTPDSDDEVDQGWSQRPKATSQRRDRYEDEPEEEDDRANRRRTDRRPAASGKKTGNREDHESNENEDLKDKGTESRKEGRARRA